MASADVFPGRVWLPGCYSGARLLLRRTGKPISPGLGRKGARRLATPVAGLNIRPTHISAKEYYSLAIDNLRTYPVYFPDREPEGYWDMLQHIGPKPLIEPEKLSPK